MKNSHETAGHAQAHGEVPEWLVWCTGQIRHRPLTALGLGATFGFILGGGSRSSFGRDLLAVVGKSLIRGAFGDLLSEVSEEHARDGVRTSAGTEAGAR